MFQGNVGVACYVWRVLNRGLTKKKRAGVINNFEREDGVEMGILRDMYS